MIVRNNTGSRRANRYLGSANSQISKTLEKLSSGYKINRAADDAAGLAISEKMRLRLTGTDRALENSQDGSRLIQTGEGALQEIQDILNRASYLAVQSANGTYDNPVDRDNLQKELDSMRREIDRIATGANFNGIELFQDLGLEFEHSTAEELARMGAVYSGREPVVPFQAQAEVQSALTTEIPSAFKAEDTPQAEPPVLAEAQERPLIVVQDYQEFRHDAVTAVSSPEGSSTLALDVTVNDNGVSKQLSDVLKSEIIPNTVNSILTQYGEAFSYLNGSSIGIGLKLYEDNGSNVLAYVGGSFGYGGSHDGAGNILNRNDSIGYTLGVNLSGIDFQNWNTEGRADLEATIAHEMIHAFMDEAATAGMSGNMAADKVPTTNVTANDFVQQVTPFPDWFVEGMAQTASGPDNWVRSSNSLHITAASTDAQILSAVRGFPLGSTGSKENAANYGTGYLACMYLGAIVGGYNGTDTNPQTMASTISNGLSKLLASMIHNGKSMDAAIRDLSAGMGNFTSTADFTAKFNSGTAPNMAGIIHNLLAASADGRGGVVSGDLSAKDLTRDHASSNSLFNLDPTHETIKNTYPAGYNVYSGGATNVDGVSPTGTPTDPVLPYYDFDNIRVYGAKQSDLTINADGTLTVSVGAGIRITMRPASDQPLPNNPSEFTGKQVTNLVLGDPANPTGTVSATLSGVSLSGSLTTGGKTEITYESDVSFGGILLGGDCSFTGTGSITAGTFDAGSHNVTFNSGAVRVRSGGIANPGAVHINGSVVAASPLPAETDGKAPIEVPWNSNLSGMGKITSLEIDGQNYAMSLDSSVTSPPANLWLDPGRDHRVTFTDANGSSKVLLAHQVIGSAGFEKFEWAPPRRPFTVNGVEGTDWEYGGADGNTLIIKSGGPLTIGTGDTVDENGSPLTGRIQVADSIGPVSLTLNGLNITQNTGPAFDLGKGNDVTLDLLSGVTNCFQSGSGSAGIAMGTGTDLTINGSNDSILTATGGNYSAGIGRNGSSVSQPADMSSSITINGGKITATGGNYGAGIGAGYNVAMGNITVTGGDITAYGGSGAAGIGGSNRANVGDIHITDATVNAVSAQHGAGIGGGWGSPSTPTKNGDITIDGNSIVTAISQEHGTGIGAGCTGQSGKITITGSAVIEKAQGGADGAGIGASWRGTCGDIEISGDAVIKMAKGGNNGAGIGAGMAESSNPSTVGNISINTTGWVSAEGGINGVGIGSGYGQGTANGSSCGDIAITGGTVKAKGGRDSTGIGAGKDSTSGNITIGDPDPTNPRQVSVTATGGMTNDGGNILSYTDKNHENPGIVLIVGSNTSVQTGSSGEGKYSTSGVPVDPTYKGDPSTLPDNQKLFCYPVYLFKTSPEPDVAKTENGAVFPLPLPSGATDIQISAASKGGSTTTWAKDLIHKEPGANPGDPPVQDNFTYIWLTGEDQDLTVSYTDPDDGSSKNVTLHLKFYPDSGKYRIENEQPKPPAVKEPEYSDRPNPPVTPDTPSEPDSPIMDPDSPPMGKGGIILQIGADYGEILEVPRFYLSVRALELERVDISTQENAQNSIGVLKNAINRVSSIRGEYGALQNRLEYNQSNLSSTVENLTDAESRIRDTDIAEEYTKYVALTIIQQSAQSMLAHSNNDSSRVLQFLE